MAFFFELLTTTVIWVTRPCILFKLACLFGLRTAFIFIVTWTELVKATIYFHLSLLSKMLVLTVAFLTLPFRVLTAISRERQLETQVRYMKSELESLFWDRKVLRQRLESAIKEHKMMELILADIEAEHDKAVAEIELLRDELQELRKENLRLIDVHGKDYWGFRSKDDNNNGHRSESTDKYGISCKTNHGGTSVTNHGGTSVILQDLIMHSNEWRDGSNATTEQVMLELLASESGPIHPAEVIEQRRDTAIGESLFSSVLSLFVGVVIWGAKDPCTPLVAALFAVVSISLKSVVEFFSTVKTKHASDAAVLLSLNCFILGALTYSTLPEAARILAPTALRLLEKAVRLIGLSFS